MKPSQNSYETLTKLSQNTRKTLAKISQNPFKTLMHLSQNSHELLQNSCKTLAKLSRNSPEPNYSAKHSTTYLCMVFKRRNVTLTNSYVMTLILAMYDVDAAEIFQQIFIK